MTNAPNTAKSARVVDWDIPRRPEGMGKTSAVTIRLPDRLLQRIESIGREKGYDRAPIIRQLLERAVQAYEESAKQKRK